ncbi:MAG TPA: phosphoglycerate mutase [Lysobacter sp.]|nr:phosphoglycerate mutase [Lysobacter sp.]
MPHDTLLLPSCERFAGLTLPDPLARALGRADRVTAVTAAGDPPAGVFDILPRGWPAAAATRQRDAGDAGDAQWLRADPAYVRPDINGARLLGYGPALGLDREDVDALLPALQPLFGDAGMALDAPAPTRWYLRLARGARLPRFVAPEVALGADLFDHLGADDTSADARRWRALLSEAQVILHNHPHNARRAERGRVPVNSLWFWGAGVLPTAVRSGYRALRTRDDALDAFARLAGVPVEAPAAHWSAGEGERLIDLRDIRDGEALVSDWLAPAAAALRAGGSLRLRLDDGLEFVVRPNQRWRLWRRPLRALA